MAKRPTLCNYDPLKLFWLDEKYDPVTSTKLTSDKRYEYDGLKLLRVDERCDADGDGEVEAGETTWRTVETSTYDPGIVGNLLAKRVYSYPGSGDRCTSNGSNDYYYAYDHVGNVYAVFDGAGAEVYHFNQDAFGNELNFENYTGSSWSTAATAGIAEHQTGKWTDSFSGLYFFHARWYDAGVGRWLSREPLLSTNLYRDIARSQPQMFHAYQFSKNVPTHFFDPNGFYSMIGPPPLPPFDPIGDGLRFLVDVQCALRARLRSWMDGTGWNSPTADLLVILRCTRPSFTPPPRERLNPPTISCEWKPNQCTTVVGVGCTCALIYGAVYCLAPLGI